MSSMVTMRSLGSVRPRIELSSEVLPDDVEPLTITLHRPARATSRTAPTASSPNASRGRARSRKRRTDRQAPSGATGGMTAHTREPSGSRASTTGDVRSRRRPSGARIRSTTTARSAAARRPAALEPTIALEPDVAAGVDEHLVDGVVGEQRVERAEPVEPGHRGAHQPLADVGRRRAVRPAAGGGGRPRRPPRLGLGGPAQLGHQHVVGRRRSPVRVGPLDRRTVAAPAARGSAGGGGGRSAARRRRHGRWRGRWLTDATTGAPTARATSAARAAPGRVR